MSRYFTLTRVLLKNGSGLFVDKGNKRSIKEFLIPIILIVSFLPLTIGISQYISVMYDQLVMINQQGIILGIGLSIVSLMVFSFGILYSLNTFYFSMDIENLLYIPLKSWHIIAGKFTVVLLYEYLTTAIFYVPIVITYGIKSSAGPVFYLYGVIIFLLLPIIPLIIATIIDMVIMRFTNIAKNKDAFRTISSILAILIIVGFNIVIQKSVTSSGDKIMEMITQGDNTLINVAKYIFPSSALGVNALAYFESMQGFINLILFIILIAAVVLVFLFLSELLYFKGVIGISETYSRRKRMSDQELHKKTSQGSKVITYAIKELRNLVRVPAYLINCVLVSLLMPLIMLIPMLFNPENAGDFEQIGELLQSGSSSVFLVIIFAAVVILSSMNSIASTAISREGKNLYVIKYLPVSFKTQFLAKALSAVIMGILTTILIIVASAILIKPSIYILLASGIISILGVVFTSFVGLLMDLNFPKLNWDSEQKVVKQNLTVMINMLVCGVIGFFTAYLAIKFKLSERNAFLAIFAVYLFIDIVLYYILSTVGVKLIKRMKV